MPIVGCPPTAPLCSEMVALFLRGPKRFFYVLALLPFIRQLFLIFFIYHISYNDGVHSTRKEAAVVLIWLVSESSSQPIYWRFLSSYSTWRKKKKIAAGLQLLLARTTYP